MPNLRPSTLVGGLLAGLMTATLSPVVPPAAAGPAGEYAKDAFRATNQERVERDRVRLDHHACLMDYATRQAKRMARAGRAYHQRLDPIISDCNMSIVGENVAAGFPTGRSVVVNGWMKSDAHRDNILFRKYRLMAVAARRDDDGRWYAAQVFGRR